MKEDKGWIPKKDDVKEAEKIANAHVDLELTKKSLMKIATGATMFFIPKEIQDDRERVKAVMERLTALVEEEFKDLDEEAVMGLKIVLACTWAASYVIKISDKGKELDL